VTSALVWLGVGSLGAAGALARFLLDGAVGRRLGRAFPFGTLIVNATGAFALGVLVGAALSGDAYRIAGTGLVGAYTTFSTWMLESYRLAEDGDLAGALVNVVASFAIGIGVALVGRHVGAAL
jgi:fluoride exporter